MDHRVGRALWSFNGSVDGHFDNDNLDATILVETRQAHSAKQTCRCYSAVPITRDRILRGIHNYSKNRRRYHPAAIHSPS